MNDEPMMIDETEDFEEPRRSTRRSWKILQLVIAGLVALFVASIATSSEWDKTFGGVTEAQLGQFDQNLKAYFDEANARGVAQVTMDTYNPIRPNQFSEAFEVAKGTYDARERLRKLVDGMSYSNRQKAQARFALSAHLHNGDEIPAEVVVEGADDSGRAWVTRNIAAGLWVTLKAAVMAFVVAWLLLKLCELLWWFLMDRLHDVANAVRRR